MKDVLAAGLYRLLSLRRGLHKLSSHAVATRALRTRLQHATQVGYELVKRRAVRQWRAWLVEHRQRVAQNNAVHAVLRRAALRQWRR